MRPIGPRRPRLLAAVLVTVLAAAPARHVSADWAQLGSGGIAGGQVEGMDAQTSQVSGAVRALLPHPTNADVLYAGAVNGGIWKTTNATSSTPSWTALGDGLASLSIGALAFDVSDPLRSTILAGFGRFGSLARTGGYREGLVRSADGGATWQTLGAGAFTGRNVSGIVANGNTIVATVNTADVFSFDSTGVFRSTDGGATFTQITTGSGLGLPQGVSWGVAMNPLDADDLVTAIALGPGSRGIYRSLDGGASWGKVSDAAVDATFASNTSNVKLSFGTAGQLYAGIVNAGRLHGLFRLGQGSAAWQSLDLPATHEPGGTVGLSPRGGKGPTSGTPEKIAGGQGAIHFSLVADPIDPDIVYVGGDRQPGPEEGGILDWPNSIGAEDYTGRLFRVDATAVSGSQSAPLTHRGGSSGNLSTLSNSSPHADSRGLAFDAVGRLLEADDGGVYARTSPAIDDAGDWTSINGSLAATEFHSVAWDPVGGVFIGGTQDVGTVESMTGGSTTLSTVTRGDGGKVAVRDLGNGTSLRYSSYYSLYGLQVRRVDAANTVLEAWEPATTGLPDEERQFYTPIAVNEATGEFVVGGQTTVYTSADGAESFTAVASTSTLPVAAMAAGAANAPGALWVGRGDGLLYTEGADGLLEFRGSAGAPLTVVTSYGGTSVVDLAVDPLDYRRLVATDMASVHFTADAGATFTDITGDLFASGGREVWSVELLRLDGVDVVFAGLRSGGIWYTHPASGAGHWLALDGLANAPVRDLDYDATDDVLLAGLQGRGAWLFDGISAIVVPEPSIGVMALAGLGGLMIRRRRGAAAAGPMQPWLQADLLPRGFHRLFGRRVEPVAGDLGRDRGEIRELARP